MPLDFTQPYQRIVGDLRDTPGAYYVQGGIAYTLDGTPIGSRVVDSPEIILNGG